jgi:hypothetical protein
LLDEGKDCDILYLKPEKKVFEKIETAFAICGKDKLKPVFDYLEGKYSYDEIRAARFFL